MSEKQKDQLSWISFAWVVFAISSAVGLAYYNSTDVPFLFDDVHNIKNNSNIQISNLGLESLTQSTYGNPTPRPIAYLTFAINHKFDQLNVRWYHLVNILIHAVNGLLVFAIVHNLLKLLGHSPNKSEHLNNRSRFWISLIAALLFVLHPIQTQSVTYIVQRMTSLCSLFYFTGILVYLAIRGSKRPRPVYTGWVFIALAWVMALGTKQIAVTLPLAIILIEWIFFQSGEKKWFSKGLKSLAIVTVLMGLTAFAFKGVDFFKLFTRGYTLREFTLAERLMTEGRVMIHYISLVFWPMPSRLALIYDFQLSKSPFEPVTTILSWIAILISLFLAFKSVRHYRVLSFSIAWFFLHLAVESTIIPLELVYEHRLYLPLFGICFAVAFYGVSARKELTFAIPIFAVILIAFGVGTYQRNQTWRSEADFWMDNIAKQPGAARCHFNLGAWYAGQKKYKLAMREYRKSVELKPNLQLGYIHIGLLFEKSGEYEKALQLYDQSLSISNDNPRGLRVASDALVARGRTLQKLRRYNEGLEALNTAIANSPSNHLGYFFRASIMGELHRPQDAIQDYLTCLKLKPDFIDANNNFAWFLATNPDVKIDRPELAIKHARIACELTQWKNYIAISTLAAAYARNGDFTNAVKWQTQSARLAEGATKARMTDRILQFKRNETLMQE